VHRPSIRNALRARRCDDLVDVAFLEPRVDQQTFAATEVGERPRTQGTDRGEAGQCGLSRLTAQAEVATVDQRLVGMIGLPTTAGPNQRVDLIEARPAVLRVVQHRQQHLQVIHRVSPSDGRRAGFGAR
jgi:hypothetical protein